MATYVGGIDEAGDSKLRVRRLVEDGHELLEVALPAVLTVIKEIGEARLPTLHGKRRARSVEIPVLGPDDLDVEVKHLGLTGSPTRVVKIFRPKVARECTKMPAKDEESIDAAVEGLLAFLKEKELV